MIDLNDLNAEYSSVVGGVSFFLARKGFAFDNVINFEVVLANGEVVEANAKENPDLFLALKGGSNNFGVVTRFDLSTFTQDDFWGGVIFYNDTVSAQLIKAFVDLNKAVGFDEYAAVIISFAYTSSTGFIAVGNLEYTKQLPNPPILQPFASLQPQFYNTMRISNLTDFAREFVQFQPKGRR